MRLATVQTRGRLQDSFTHAPFAVACVHESEFVPLHRLSSNPVLGPFNGGTFSSLTSAVGRLDQVSQRINALLASNDTSSLISFDPSTVRFCPPIPYPRTFRDFYAFEAHVKNARKRRGLEMIPQWYEFPAFYFSNPGTLVGHEADVRAPRDCQELDYELELGIVIGKGGKDISAEEAWEHVAGFTIINDFSARDIQRKEMAIGLGPAKGKDFATGVGPYLVTLDEFQDRMDKAGRVDLEMIARVNGKELSRGNAKTMHFTWPQIIARASADAELFPGDLIGSGTIGTGCILELGPENTGGWLKPGDMVECEIERLGVLRNRIVARS